MKRHIAYILLLTVGLMIPSCSMSKRIDRSIVLEKVFGYSNSIVLTETGADSSYAYTKYYMKVYKRNALLLAVPTMYVVAHGGTREYLVETYEGVSFKSKDDYTTKNLLNISTIPHRQKTMKPILKYLTPNIYSASMIDDYILSPFHKHNKKYYKYRVSYSTGNMCVLRFIPKLKSTQLVDGTAIVDTGSGRILSTEFKGEYDMIRFSLHIKLSDKERFSLFPTECKLETRFHLLGNDIRSNYVAKYDLDKNVSDTLKDKHDITIMEQVRPDKLSDNEQHVYDKYYAKRRKNDSTTIKKKDNVVKTIMWDMIGENLLTRIKSKFGPNDEGYVRISPIINPLYMGYDHRRGFYYKFDVRGVYQFSDNQDIWVRFRAGYSFKQKQFYYKIPMMYYFNRRKNGFLQIEFGNGNRITNSTVIEKLKEEQGDTIKWKDMNLDYFSDMYLKLIGNYSISKKFSIQPGIIMHRRVAIDKQAFVAVGKPTSYRTVAPSIELSYMPLGTNNLVINANYERSFKGFCKSNIVYERFEFDAQCIWPLKGLQNLSMRLGSGFYTNKENNWYFLDYTNFKDNNIPGGWNDEWSGEFELLNSNWYNSSEYYVRANATYESPILFTSWIPLVGMFIETERLYMSALVVNHLHPYTEIGYGFTTRLFSMGVFVANKNGKFDGFGCKFGFELFRQW